MGGVNVSSAIRIRVNRSLTLPQSFFFAHFWPESRDEYFSCCNEREAHMIVAFYHHLIRNGVGSSHITVLTLYNGQRKLILKKLKYHPDLQGHIFNVRTVDSYQGQHPCFKAARDGFLISTRHRGGEWDHSAVARPQQPSQQHRLPLSMSSAQMTVAVCTRLTTCP